jgi:hypothetical protein
MMTSLIKRAKHVIVSILSQQSELQRNLRIWRAHGALSVKLSLRELGLTQQLKKLEDGAFIESVLRSFFKREHEHEKLHFDQFSYDCFCRQFALCSWLQWRSLHGGILEEKWKARV